MRPQTVTGRPGATRRGSSRRSSRGLLQLVLEQPRALVLVAALSLVSSAASLLQPVLVGRIIGNVSVGDDVGRLVWAVAGLLLGGGLAAAVQQFHLQRMAETLVLTVRRRLLDRVLHLRISELDQRRTGDLVSRLSSDTTLLRAALTQGLTAAVGGAVLFFGALAAMLVIDPPLFAIMVLVVAGSTGAVLVLAGGVQRASAEAQARVGQLSSALERAVSAIRTVRAANATGRERDAMVAHARQAWAAGIVMARSVAIISPVSAVSIQMSLLVILGVGGYRIAAGTLSVADLVAFLLFLFLMVMPLNQAFSAITAVSQALGAFDRVTEIMGLPVEGARLPVAVSSGSPPSAASVAPALSFEDVHFGYPGARTGAGEPQPSADGRPSAALRGLSFEVPQGARVALVGPSGAGKTTVLSLVERFYDPDTGVIRVDGVDVSQIDHETHRRRIGYVEQGAPVLAGTVRENITLGAPDATDAESEAVLVAVGLGAVLGRGAAGLDTEVGENGVTLSGGERQRLALARALLGRPSILLLDESTSSLDGRNEQIVSAAIAAAAADCTVLVVAHRLATVIDSDVILVLDEGRVVARGTHRELVESTLLYRELAQYQLLV